METLGCKILNAILENEQINANQFAESIGLSRTQPIYDILNGKVKKITSNYANKILSAYPHYNYLWLTTGTGDMLKSNNANRGSRFDLKLFRLENRLSQVQLAEYLGVTQSFISQVEKEDRPLPDEYISKIQADGIYKIDLTNNISVITSKEPSSGYLPDSNFKLIPLYSSDVVGGIHNQEADTMGYIMGYMPFVNAKEGDISVLVTGNSMYPLYPSGSFIQIRRLDYWKEFIEFGQVHVIELLDDRRLIKEVRKGCDNKHFTLVSSNEKFDDIEISTDFIRSVWLVLAKYEKSTM